MPWGWFLEMGRCGEYLTPLVFRSDVGRRGHARFLRPHEAVLDDGDRAKKRAVRRASGAHDRKGAVLHRLDPMAAPHRASLVLRFVFDGAMPFLSLVSFASIFCLGDKNRRRMWYSSSINEARRRKKRARPRLFTRRASEYNICCVFLCVRTEREAPKEREKMIFTL